MKNRSYLFRVLYSIDQLANAMVGGNPDETVSSALGKKQRRGCKLCRFICGILNIVDPNHCEKSIEEDESKNTWGGTSGRNK